MGIRESPGGTNFYSNVSDTNDPNPHPNVPNRNLLDWDRIMKLKSLRELSVAGKAVLVRAGFDVPMDGGLIADDFRIAVSAPTIEYLAKNRARVIILSHLDRPQSWDSALSLLPAAERLAEMLKRKFVAVEAEAKKLPEYAVPHLFFFAGNLEKDNVADLCKQLRDGDIAVLENLRFYPGETAGDEVFAEKLAVLGEIYVNDAFSDLHRGHASISVLPKLMDVTAAGFSLEKELRNLTQVAEHPKKPLVVMIGGVKLAGKISALESLAAKADFILLGGGAASLFLKIRGYEIGKSVVSGESRKEEKNMEMLAKQIWRDHKGKIKLPLDAVVSSNPESSPEHVAIDKVKPSQMILDIGPATILEYSKILKQAKTIVWSGPLGHFEKPSFAAGTFALARLFASRAKNQSFGVAGGGETLEVLKTRHLSKYVDHLCTGGGAMMEFLAGKTLPGLASLELNSAVRV